MNKNIKLILIIVGILVAVFASQRLVYQFVDLRGSKEIPMHEEGHDDEHEPGTPEEHAH